MKKDLIICALIIFVPLSLLAQSESRNKNGDSVLKVGFGMANITPLYGTAISGLFGTAPTAQYVHDELHVRAMVINNGIEQIAIGVIDNVGLPQKTIDSAKLLINRRTGILKDHILLSSIHNHSGPEVEAIIGEGYLDQYGRFVAERIAQAVQNAVHHLQPAKVGWGTVRIEDQVFNRRWFMKDTVLNPFGEKEIVKMNPGVGNPDAIKPAGPTDPILTFLGVESPDGKPLGLFANYSLHYIGGIPLNVVSADYFAEFAEDMKHLLGADRQDPPFVGIMSNGTQGDINNIDVKGDPRDYAEGVSNMIFNDTLGLNPDKKLSKGEKRNYAPFERIKVITREIAEKVYAEYQKIEFKEWIPISVKQSNLSLAVRKPSPDLQKRITKILSNPDNNGFLYHPLEKAFSEIALDLLNNWPDTVEAPLQTIKMGRLGIAAIPFEPFAEMGLELKERSPSHPTMIVGLANGYYGYLPTPRQHKLGGYETWLGSNIVEKDASEKIIGRLLEMFNELEK